MLACHKNVADPLKTVEILLTYGANVNLTDTEGSTGGCKVSIPIAIFLRRGAELSDEIVEVIKRNTRFQWERSLAAQSVAIFIALTKSDSNRVSPL
jgi:hypothetical protein